MQFHSQQYDYKRKVANFYHSSPYSRADSESRNLDLNKNENLSRDFQNRFLDPYRNSSFGPGVPLVQEWQYIRSDFYLFRNGEPSEPFILYLNEVLTEMGTLDNIQVWPSLHKISVLMENLKEFHHYT